MLDSSEITRIRAEAAAEERAALLELIEDSLRRLAHGHGADGTRVLLHLLEAVRGRGEAAAEGTLPGAPT